jgi:hypothetical protein
VFSPGERCPARIELSDFQVLWLKRRPYAAQSVRPDHECQLEFRHHGPHGALGQQCDDIEWWVRWTMSCSTVDQVTACPGVSDEPGEPQDDDACLLFEGHPGRHSFDLTQW